MSVSSRFELRASSHLHQPPPPPVGMSGDGGTFADAGNLEHCAKYLNQTLVTFGFPASLDLFATDPVSIARTCNCMYALLQQRQRDIEFRESTNDLRQRKLILKQAVNRPEIFPSPSPLVYRALYIDALPSVEAPATVQKHQEDNSCNDMFALKSLDGIWPLGCYL